MKTTLFIKLAADEGQGKREIEIAAFLARKQMWISCALAYACMHGLHPYMRIQLTQRTLCSLVRENFYHRISFDKF
jgi:hypothetical protein